MAALFLENERWGNGNAGVVSESSVTDTPIDAEATGTAGTKTISATNGSFAAGQIILIIDRTSGAREINVIASYVAGTITTKYALQNTYTAAQVIVGAQHANYTATSVTVKAFDGSVGGVFFRVANGKITINSLTGTGKGFRAQSGAMHQGEGYPGTGATSNAANGNGAGGGGGNVDAGHVEAGHGGGGGNGATGENGGGRNISPGGAGGAATGNATNDTIFMGGAGGNGGNGYGSGSGRQGGNGGPIVVLIAPTIEFAGAAPLNGNAGQASTDNGGAGGGGAAGSADLVCQVATLGSNLLTALGGVGGTCTGAFGGKGGDGAVGRIHIWYSDSISGTTNPTYASTKSSALGNTDIGGMI